MITLQSLSCPQLYNLKNWIISCIKDFCGSRINFCNKFESIIFLLLDPTVFDSNWLSHNNNKVDSLPVVLASFDNTELDIKWGPLCFQELLLRRKTKTTWFITLFLSSCKTIHKVVHTYTHISPFPSSGSLMMLRFQYFIKTKIPYPPIYFYFCKSKISRFPAWK